MDNKSTIFSVRHLADIILEHKRQFCTVVGITGLLACIWILPEPRTYKSSVRLAPETSGAGMGGTLSSVASSFGIDLGSVASTDAIYPQLYPDLFKSTAFVISLLDITVETSDQSVRTDLQTYYTKHQKRNPVKVPFFWAMRQVKRLTASAPRTKAHADTTSHRGINPFWMSPEETMLVAATSARIECNIDRKNDVITITVSDQDPLVCALLADSVSARLQRFITDYRTKKARHDYDYYSTLLVQAKRELDEAIDAYSQYTDANKRMTSQQSLSTQERLHDEMLLKNQIYNTIAMQQQAANAKVQEHTPVFTTIDGASVPAMPSGPRRTLYVVTWLIVAIIGTSIYYLAKELKADVTRQPSAE